MPANPLATFLPLMFILMVGATTALPATNEQQKPSETTCPEGFLAGYPCREQQRADRITKSQQDSIGFIGDILARRAAENLRVPIPGLPDDSPGPEPKQEFRRPSPDSERDGSQHPSISGPGVEAPLQGRQQSISGEASPLEREDGQAAAPNPIAMEGAAPPTSEPAGQTIPASPNVEEGTGVDGKHQAAPKGDKGPDDETIQPPITTKNGNIARSAKTNGPETQNETVRAHPVPLQTQEYRHIRECLRKGRCPDQVLSPAEDPVSGDDIAQQEMEIYRIDSCVIGKDRGESKLPADNLTCRNPSGRLLAGFKPGKYKIEKDSFLPKPKFQRLFASLEHSLLGYKLPEDETVLILGYADHIPYTGDPLRIGQHKNCSLPAGKLLFNEVEAVGGNRLANDDGNLRLALARAQQIQKWLEKKGVLESDSVCLMASPIPPEIDSVPDGEPLDRAVAVYILRTKARTTEANHVQP